MLVLCTDVTLLQLQSTHTNLFETVLHVWYRSSRNILYFCHTNFTKSVKIKTSFWIANIEILYYQLIMLNKLSSGKYAWKIKVKKKVTAFIAKICFNKCRDTKKAHPAPQCTFHQYRGRARTLDHFQFFRVLGFIEKEARYQFWSLIKGIKFWSDW